MDRAQLEDLLAHVVRSGGRSLHLMPSHRPFVRMGDEVMAVEAEPTSSQVLRDLLRDFLFEDHKQQLERGEEVEVVYTTAAGDRFRTLVMRQCRGLAVVFRRMPELVPDFETLGLPPVLGGLTSFRRGIAILTGFYGSGKSTTLASLVDRLNSEGAHHIATVESPIEYLHVSQKSLIHQREVGTHVASIAAGVADAQRLGAEIIVVDSLDDLDTLLAVFEAVERGAFVLATMDSGSVVSAVADLAKKMPEGEREMLLFRLAKLLRAVVAQSLIQRAHGKGRVPVFEIMIRTRAIARLIRDGQFHDIPERIGQGRGLGMQTTDQALRSLLQHNVIAAEEAAYHAVDRDWVLGNGAGSPMRPVQHV